MTARDGEYATKPDDVLCANAGEEELGLYISER